MHQLNRRGFLTVLGCIAAGLGLFPGVGLPQSRELIKRAIPSTGEQLPVIGMGSWITFSVGNDARARAIRRDVLQAFFDQGGALIDSSPMYGSSEEVIGDLLK